ncbi:hypothetical protein BJF83_05170 [Nocardiopsis sp. CNR-923]|uniref:hypothetical protein n=1 Tax=Nocardiopsis sp. CNR-923 TaxID=1904965 RepID=UPI0009680DC7|nr:hypothetical protein [Nocardiopsis sp. CNR-923]OLT25557.1 hypothetical protein BJF83_05170 [Nocardiopsis sp. CNR-923]
MSAKTDLACLRAEYGNRYWIRCTEHSWITTDRDPHTTTELTLMADTLGQLATRSTGSPRPSTPTRKLPTSPASSTPSASQRDSDHLRESEEGTLTLNRKEADGRPHRR